MVLMDTGTLGTSREIYSEDADGETRKVNHALNASHVKYAKSQSYSKSYSKSCSKY